MNEVEFEPLAIHCPRCKCSGYMYRLVGKNVGDINVKCINCNSYFKETELRVQLIGGGEMNNDVEIIKEEVCERCSNMTPWQDCKNCLLARAIERIAKGDKPHTFGYATGQ